MTPTPTDIPTPTPTPQAVVTVIEAGLQENYLPMIGAVWAVLVLFCVLQLVNNERQRNTMAFFVICFVSSPLLLVNIGLWALSIYIFVCLYMVLVAMQSIVK